MSNLLDRITLAMARADGQDWDSLDDAPSRAQFMGYPAMARAAVKVVVADTGLLTCEACHGSGTALPDEVTR